MSLQRTHMMIGRSGMIVHAHCVIPRASFEAVHEGQQSEPLAERQTYEGRCTHIHSDMQQGGGCWGGVADEVHEAKEEDAPQNEE